MLDATHTMFSLRNAAERFDVLHVHSPFSSLAAAVETTVPAIHTLHGSFTPEMSRLYAQVADRAWFVAISEAQRRTNEALRYAGVVYNGIDVDRYPFVTEKDDYLLFLGRAAPEKGWLRAVETARLTGRRLISAVKISHPTEIEEWEGQIRPILPEGSEVLGEIGHEEKASLLAHAQAVLFPIDWDEPFGLVMTEAMACGTPVIATPRGSVPEVIADGETGWIVDVESYPEEAAERLAKLDSIDRPPAATASGGCSRRRPWWPATSGSSPRSSRSSAERLAAARGAWPRAGTRSGNGAYLLVPRPGDRYIRAEPMRIRPLARRRGIVEFVTSGPTSGSRTWPPWVCPARMSSYPHAADSGAEVGRVHDGDAEPLRRAARDHPCVVPVDVRVVEAEQLDGETLEVDLAPHVAHVLPAAGPELCHQIGAAAPTCGARPALRREVLQVVERLRHEVVVRTQDEPRGEPAPCRRDRCHRRLHRPGLGEEVAGHDRDVGGRQGRDEGRLAPVAGDEVQVRQMQDRQLGRSRAARR
jgi:hypothetical protein